MLREQQRLKIEIARHKIHVTVNVINHDQHGTQDKLAHSGRDLRPTTHHRTRYTRQKHEFRSTGYR